MKKILFSIIAVLSVISLGSMLRAQDLRYVRRQSSIPATCVAGTPNSMPFVYQGDSQLYTCVGGVYVAVATTASGGSVSGLTAGRVVVAASATSLTNYAGFTHDGTTLTVAALKDTGLTSGRIPFATTGGLLTDAAGFTFTSGVNNQFTVSSSESSFNLTSTVGGGRQWQVYSGGGSGFTTGQFGIYNASVGGTPISINASNRVTINGTSLYTAQFNITPDASTTIGQIIKLAASQSADALQVQDSSGSSIFRVNNSGIVIAYRYLQLTGGSTNGWRVVAGISGDYDNYIRVENAATNVPYLMMTNTGLVGIGNTVSNPGAQLGIVPVSSSTVGQIIKLAASQSADALQVQDSSGTVLMRISKNGYIGVGVDPTAAIAHFYTTGGTAQLKVERNTGTASTTGATTVIHSNFGYSGGTGADSIWRSDWGFGIQTNLQSGSPTSVLVATSTGNLMLGPTVVQQWSSSGLTSPDSGIARNAAGILEVNNGTAGTYRDLRVRYLGVGAPPSSSNPFYAYTNDSSLSGTSILAKFEQLGTVTGNQTSYQIAIYGSINTQAISAGITDSGYRRGFQLDMFLNTSSFAGTLQEQTGGYVNAGIYTATAGAVLNSSYGYRVVGYNNTASTTVSLLYGFHSNLVGATAGTVTTRHNFFVPDSVVANGTGQSGLTIGVLSGATNNTHLLLGTTTIPSGTHGAYIVSSAAAAIPLYIKGAASQSGNLTNWVDSSSTVLASITSAGNLLFGSTSRAIYWTDTNTGIDVSGSDVRIRSYGGNIIFYNTNTSSAAFTFSTASGNLGLTATTNYFYWADVNTSILGDNGSGFMRFRIYGNGSNGFEFWDNNISATVAKFIRAVSAVNYLSFTNSATTVALPITANGTDSNIAITINPKGTGTLQVNAGAAGANILTLKEAASHTGNVLDMQNSSGTSLTKFDFNGNFFAGPSTIETFTTTGSAFGSSVNYYTDSQTIYYSTASAANDITVAVKAASAINLDTRLATGQAVTLVIKVTNGGVTAYKVSALTIDGNAQTIKWLNGSAPSGNLSSVDTYSFTIYKTGSGTFYVEGMQQTNK